MEPVDAKISDAMLQVRKSIKSLSHDATNPHGGYTYVSIDSLYKQVIPLANEAGVVWRLREESWELIGNQGRNKDRSYVRSTVVADVMAGGATALGYMTLTIMLPVEGPQTTGQIFSYADRTFMRVAFGIPTGEPEGDAVKPEPVLTPPHDPITGEILQNGPPTPPTVLTASQAEQVVSGKTPKGQPQVDTRKVNKDNLEIVYQIFATWVPTLTTRDDLLNFFTENLAAIEMVGKYDPGLRDKVKFLFSARKNELNV